LGARDGGARGERRERGEGERERERMFTSPHFPVFGL